MSTGAQGPSEGGLTLLRLPWLDYASTVMPTNHNLILWWAQYLWLTDGNYRSAYGRVVSHFITALEFPDLEAEEESAYKDLFLEHLNYVREFQAAGEDFAAYGNVVLSLYLPFRRSLACENCGFEQPIQKVEYDLSLENREVRWRRRAPCPKCGDNHDYELRDRRDGDISRVRLIRYSPFEIEIAQNMHSQRKDIYWKIPSDYRRDIQSGARIFVDDTPVEILEAVARNGRFKFDEDMVLHLDETAISGMRTRGWGVPRSISNFRTAWLQQIINRADQAIASDYTLGMRVISPANNQATDPLLGDDMDGFVGATKRMIGEHRADPMTYHTAPYALQYQFLGGEGRDLLPADKLKYRQQEFLNQMNIPLEYHQMSLTTQAAPMALRLFETAWQAFPALYNTICKWIVKLTSRTFGMEETAVSIQRSTLADDMEYRSILMQLMAGNQISPQTALRPFNIDAADEARNVFRHQDFIAKLQEEQAEKDMKKQEMAAVSAMTAAPGPTALLQEQMAAQQGGGAPPPQGTPMGGIPMGGVPMGGGGDNLAAMGQQAEQMAQQLVSMPEWDRKQQLRQLRESNKDLHGLVTAAMERIRRGAASQGQQMLLQPQVGGPPPA